MNLSPTAVRGVSCQFAFEGVKPAGFLRSEVRSSVRSGGGAPPVRESHLFESEMVARDK